VITERQVGGDGSLNAEHVAVFEMEFAGLYDASRVTGLQEQHGGAGRRCCSIRIRVHGLQDRGAALLRCRVPFTESILVEAVDAPRIGLSRIR
jgi:hypothetical protein